MAKRHDNEVKRQVVSDILEGRTTALEAANHLKVKPNTIARWLREYGERQVPSVHKQELGFDWREFLLRNSGLFIALLIILIMKNYLGHPSLSDPTDPKELFLFLEFSGVVLLFSAFMEERVIGLFRMLFRQPRKNIEHRFGFEDVLSVLGTVGGSAVIYVGVMRAFP